MQLKDIRERKGVKQKAVADYIGVCRQTYDKYERAPEKLSIEQASAICHFLHCNLSDIFLTSEVNLTNIKEQNNETDTTVHAS